MSNSADVYMSTSEPLMESFSELIPCANLEEQEWLLRKLDEAKGPYCYDFEPVGDKLLFVWISCQNDAKYFSAGGIADVVAEFQKAFPVHDPWIMGFSIGCRIRQLSSFYGGAFAVYHGRVKCRTSGPWCYHLENAKNWEEN